MIRPAAERDLAVLRDVERAAGEGFREIGMAPVADDDPPTIEALRGYVAAGRAWVTEEGGRVVAYLIADLVDGNVHVEQVSVHPDHAHHGYGRALLEHLARWSVDRGYPAMTLTTFTDVPWNGPYYVRCGFRRLDDDEATPELRVLRAREAEHGLDRWPRTCMRRDL